MNSKVAGSFFSIMVLLLLHEGVSEPISYNFITKNVVEKLENWYSALPSEEITCERNVSATIIILAYNRPALLQMLLDKLAAQSCVGALETIVVDDGSTPPLLHRLSLRTSLRYLYFAKDGSYHRTRNLNSAALLATNDQIIILDDDIFPISPYWVYKMTFDLPRHEFKVSRGQIVFLSLNNESNVPNIALEQEFLVNLENFDVSKPEMGFFSTCNLALSKKAWNSIGGLDPVYDGHYGYEDMDFGKRAESLHPVLCSHHCIAFHLGIFYAKKNPQIRDESRNFDIYQKRWG